MSTTAKGWRRLTSRPPIPDQQNETDAWVALKNRRIGGRAAATICGLNPYQTLDQLYDKIVHGIVDPKTAEEDAFLSWRLSMEPLVADRYAREQGRDLERMASAFDDAEPMLMLNPDYGIVHLPDRGDGILEIKTREPMVWTQIKLKGAPGGDWVQAQFYLMVAGLSWASICEANVSTGKQLVHDIEADPAFHSALRERIEIFLQACERGERPAPPDPVERIPAVGGELVTASQMSDQLIAEFANLAKANITAREVFAAAESFKKETDEDMKRWMRRHSFDVVEGFGGRFYYKEQAGRKKLDETAFKRAHPDIDLEDFRVRGEPYRTYRPYLKPDSFDPADEQRALNAAALLSPETE